MKGPRSRKRGSAGRTEGVFCAITSRLRRKIYDGGGKTVLIGPRCRKIGLGKVVSDIMLQVWKWKEVYTQRKRNEWRWVICQIVMLKCLSISQLKPQHIITN